MFGKVTLCVGSWIVVVDRVAVVLGQRSRSILGLVHRISGSLRSWEVAASLCSGVVHVSWVDGLRAVHGGRLKMWTVTPDMPRVTTADAKLVVKSSPLLRIQLVQPSHPHGVELRIVEQIERRGCTVGMAVSIIVVVVAARLQVVQLGSSRLLICMLVYDSL